MILRVPDYYESFQCIADRCQDSCCIGWEIDIDEDTCAYYHSIQGDFGERLRAQMYITEDKEHSFQLGKHGRCPFLNSKNLCDIITELGEEALSEVCTEYPRFSLYYGDVLQKCLSLSCEEVGRILFSREEPVSFVDFSMEEPEYEFDDEDACDDNYEEEDDPEVIARFVAAQQDIIAILEDRQQTIPDRIASMMQYGEKLQKELNETEENDRIEATDLHDWTGLWTPEKERFEERLSIFLEMETLDEEWESYKAKLISLSENPAYEKIVQTFLDHEGYLERDYENLLVYFVFRYFMNAVYDNNVLSKLRMAVEFTLLIRDMDALRLLEKNKYSLEDRIDVVRIFSKEVEHSEDNVAMAEEELLWNRI